MNADPVAKSANTNASPAAAAISAKRAPLSSIDNEPRRQEEQSNKADAIGGAGATRANTCDNELFLISDDEQRGAVDGHRDVVANEAYLLPKMHNN